MDTQKIIGKAFTLLAFLVFIPSTGKAANDTVYVDVNLDMVHTVGDESVFDRNKMVNIHADVTENEWEGDNVAADLRNHFLNGYDVYMGRNTGGISWNLNANITEDPARTGYANPADITSLGESSRSSYGGQSKYHGYEDRNEQVICAQLHPFWPDGQTTSKGWSFSQTDTDEEPFGTATGEYMGRFIDEFYGTGGSDGQPTPVYCEVINEPLWHLVDYGDDDPSTVFHFHNAVADELKTYNPDLLIGGFCTAFPDLEKNNFQQWEERWKLFMDIAGENMDFWSIHLYDFPAISNGQELYRKGSNMEATFDMMEQYSYLSFGVAKPFLISEFGAQMHDYWGAWSAYRDWLHLKSVNSMMMQFMERPNLISKAINFLPVKAEWGTGGVDDTYNHRLMRKSNEPSFYTGQWVYTDMVKTYQLWSDVNGTRVESKSSNPDIMCDVYVDGNKVYVILNNLEFESKTVNLKLLGTEGTIDTLNQKRLYLKIATPALEVTEIPVDTELIELNPEGTVILEYIYDTDITMDESLSEIKYYATELLKPISAYTAIDFTIEDVVASSHGEAILRLGIGRSHALSRTPEVSINGVSVNVPENYRGGPQTDRPNFFGVIEIPVPYDILADDNSISILFPDDGGNVSSVALQVFNFSREVPRSNYHLTALNTPEKENRIKIWPNPAKEFISVEVPEEFTNTKLSIYSLSGQLIMSQGLNSDSEKINIGNLDKGIYLLKIYNHSAYTSSQLFVKD